MSHFIEDDKKVIKTTRGYIFMLLGGDNNVTESKWVGGKKKWAEVRAREWFHYNHTILEATEAEIMAFCQEAFGAEPDHEVHKRNNKWLYRKDMPNYFRSGIRHAQSLEQLIRANPGQTLNACITIYETASSCSSVSELHKCLRTTEELEAWLDEAKVLRAKHQTDGKECYIRLKFDGTKPLIYGCAENIGQVVIKHTSHNHPGYVCSYMKDNSISFTQDLEKAVVFESEEAARAAIGNSWRNIKFVSLVSQKKAVKPKTYCLQFGAGSMNNYFFYKSTSSKVYGTPFATSAKLFSSEKEATATAKRLRDRGCGESRYGKFFVVNTTDKAASSWQFNH